MARLARYRPNLGRDEVIYRYTIAGDSHGRIPRCFDFVIATT